LKKIFESALRNNKLDPKNWKLLMDHILLGSWDIYYHYSKVEKLRKKYTNIELLRKLTILSSTYSLRYENTYILWLLETLL